MTLQQNLEKTCLITFTNFQHKKTFLKNLLLSLTTKGQSLTKGLQQARGQFPAITLNSRDNIQSIVKQLFQKQSQTNDITFFIHIQQDKSVQIHFEKTNTDPANEKQYVVGRLSEPAGTNSLLHGSYISQMNTSIKDLIKEDNISSVTISKKYSEQTTKKSFPVQKLSDLIKVNFPITIYFEGYTHKNSFDYTFSYNELLKESQQQGVPTNFLQRVIEKINES